MKIRNAIQKVLPERNFLLHTNLQSDDLASALLSRARARPRATVFLPPFLPSRYEREFSRENIVKLYLDYHNVLVQYSALMHKVSILRRTSAQTEKGKTRAVVRNSFARFSHNLGYAIKPNTVLPM